MIISFAWTTAALLSGQKSVTRRDWQQKYAAQFRPGDLVDAWDRLPRAHGKKVATIRITAVRHEAGTCDGADGHLLDDTDRVLEGVTWSERNGIAVPDPHFASWEAWWSSFRASWLEWGGYAVEFELVSVDRSAGAGRPIAGERQVEGSAPESDPSVHHAERDDLGRPRPISLRDGR